MSKTALITGVAGMLGRAVAQECLERGWAVTGIDNLASGRREYVPEGVDFLPLDILSLRKEFQFDLVFHLAAEPFIPHSYTAPTRFVETNVNGTLRFLEALRSCGRILVVSSSEVYGTPADKKPMTEDIPPSPQSTYAVTKLAAEQLARCRFWEHRQPIVLFRPFNCYGTHCTQPYVIPEIMRQLIHNPRDRSGLDQAGTTELHLGNLDTVRDFTYAPEMAWAMVETAIHGATGETYHWGSGQPMTIRELAARIQTYGDLTGQMPSSTWTRQDQTRLRPNDVEYLCCDRTKLERIIGRPPHTTNMREGLRKLWDWYRSIGFKWPWEAR